MGLFRRGRVSIGKACELLSLDRVAFARRAAELDIPYFQMTKDDWAAEKLSIESWPQS
jgi:predicted HTH domain antitoxin